MSEINVETKQILEKIRFILQDKLCKNIVILDLTQIHSSLSYFVIATANSHYHTNGVSQEIARELKYYRKNSPNTSDDNSGWQVLDYYDIFVHIMTEEMRDLYKLEKLWIDAKRIEL